MLKRLIAKLFAPSTPAPGSSNSRLITPAEFTEDYVNTLQNTHPELTIEVVQDLELRVAREGQPAVSTFLHNVYDVYKQAPGDKATIFEKFTLTIFDLLDLQDKKLDPSRIVPIVKDRAWIEETRASLATRGDGEPPEHIVEGLNSELVILYAEDLDNSIRYISHSDLAEAGIESWNLRDLACENLRRLLPKIECHGENGLYMLAAGGNFEASLPLLDFVWKDPGLKVDGEFVFAIPARDLLVITGSKDGEGIAKLHQINHDVFSQNGSYRLTQKLFLYRQGEIEIFEEESDRNPTVS
ncbi:DUF1444 family protein [Verrucomicrobium sp. BvORR106]|uniref:DUF1444 family protein n=1 Tax=Verrucomicrobium sp. BvORR106 TaxID=1403819 RepID=UPI0005717297|nr:DUF1444 family protein [Verrucomicrobium sp. BvORR106]